MGDRHNTVVDRARRRAQDLLAVVPVPRPWSLDDWIDALETHRDRPIDLVEMVYTPGGPVGAWRKRADRDLIAYATNTTLCHQDFTVVHEVGHMICEHRGTCMATAQARELAPDLSERMLGHLLGRATTDDEELEAETIATVVLAETSMLPMVDPAATPADVAKARRLTEVFG